MDGYNCSPVETQANLSYLARQKCVSLFVTIKLSHNIEDLEHRLALIIGPRASGDRTPAGPMKLAKFTIPPSSLINQANRQLIMINRRALGGEPESGPLTS